MDLDPVESRERAASSEPCATRPNPFDEDDGSSSRKRQRVSGGGSRSISPDARAPSTNIHDSTTPIDSETEADVDLIPPHTPTRTLHKPTVELNSSKVTINLRASRVMESMSTPSSSPGTPSRISRDNRLSDKRMSIESEDAGASADAPLEISSSPSTAGSPRIELVSDEEDAVFNDQRLPVAILDDDELLEDLDPLESFPYRSLDESSVQAVGRIAQFFEHETVDNDEAFCKLRDWIRGYLLVTKDRQSSWFTAYKNEREFWSSIPDIIWALCKRRNFFGQFLQRSMRSRRSFSELFQAFAELTAHFVVTDVNNMAGYLEGSLDGSQPSLASRPYLSALSWLMRKDQETGHIGRNLETHYRWNWSEDITFLMNTFFEAGASIPVLTKLVQGQLALMSQTPKIVDDLVEPCRIIARAVTDAAITLNQADGDVIQQSALLETANEVIDNGYEFYQVLAAGLIPVIEKHVTFLTPEAALAHIQGLSTILSFSAMCKSCPAHSLILKHNLANPDVPETQTAYVISQEWKFEMLKRLVISGQMQLRVVGVTQMCAELLAMFTKHKKDYVPEQNPLLLHFANFFLQNKLVDYIVGIGSHPEIINESYNIVGFLVATKTYTNQQTDTIWQTVVESQDPRVVDAVLRMFGPIINLFDYESLLYLCKKIGELPLEAFTIPMRDHCEKVLQQLVRTGIDRGQPIDAPPYEMCVSLIRESSIYRPEAPAGFLDIQLFASTRLRELVIHGPEAQIRNEIYISCIDDMAKRSPTATGSICALFGLLRQNIGTDLHVLTTHHGLTRLMIEELEFTSDAERAASVPLSINSPARQARRELLLAIIVSEPATITPELGLRFWNTFVGRNARSDEDRETAWQILNSAVKKAPLKNVFLMTCFQEYLPTLEPQYYTLGSLDFAREDIHAWLREAKGDLLDEEESAGTNGVEQLWRMILNAPPNTIEGPAVNMLVELYTSSQLILSMARPRAHTVQSTLVKRCLSQLSSAAGKLKAFSDDEVRGDDDMMVDIVPRKEVVEQELIFTRSLLLLREFLRTYQSRPQFMAAKARPKVLNVSDEIIGESFDIKYQSFDGGEISSLKSLSIGTLNTVADLFACIQKATGFNKVRVFHSGQELEIEVDGAMKIDRSKLGNSWMLIKRQDGELAPNDISPSNSLKVELEIESHFDELWEYLGMEEKLAQEIYHFLVKFPAYIKLLEAFGDSDTPLANIFPPGQPFKCLYAVYALREYLAKPPEGISGTSTTSRAMGLIVWAISSNEVLDGFTDEELRNFLTQALISILIQLLREPLTLESSALYLDDKFLGRLLQLLHVVKLNTTSQTSIGLVGGIFDAILEASSQSQQFWKSFISGPKTLELLEELLLEDSRPTLRRTIMKLIESKCSFTSSLSCVSATDFAMAFWPLMKSLVAHAVLQQQNCEETLSLTLSIFRKLAGTDIASVKLDECLSWWGSLLIDHKSNETIGHPDCMDMVARGLAQLLFWCSSFSKASKHPLPSNNFALSIFEKHLFPNQPDDEGEHDVYESSPILNTGTRKLLADTIIFLTRDDKQQYESIMGLLNVLLPYLPEEENPYMLDLTFAFDRSKSIRSTTGYVGLRNLSNTCYLNSLFTQLFMNVSFRQFMLHANVADGASQKLLSETQKLFSYMQNSIRRFVDPSSLASSIRTYDDSHIDVSIQMDVDEFYNLLFDRWEGQILSATDKEEFRSFYGGKLVQQVKSKECPHISERLEPFSAIQCDIKGKTSLQESLQAYVDGEVMEGDNKYKCSTCDRHVNAVKRACLKDVPDNLIFHLKRFDFNLRTMQRSKINDYFSFPEKIDMRPYKVGHLMELPEGSDEDMFELVGVLVHSGTAESGHYYSYIRERPSPTSTSNWIEFNDDHVLSFDPSFIEANCFGGVDYRGAENGNFQFEKSWSAYMLFYQRSSVLQAQQNELVSAGSPRAMRIPIYPSLSNNIIEENELIMRKYCLYDESHAPFVLRMLDNLQHLNQGRCSESHVLETAALSTALLHVDQIVSRTKDLPDFNTYMVTLCHKFQTCHLCSRDFLEWMIVRPEVFRQLILRNPEQIVRGDTVTAVLLALNKLKQDSPNDYGLYEDVSGSETPEQQIDEDPSIFRGVLAALLKMWDNFHLSTRAWPEYFGLLGSMAQLGVQEIAVFIDAGFLQKILTVLSWDAGFPHHPQYSRMIAIISKRPATKQVSLESAINLLEVLLEPCDLSLDIIPDSDERFDIMAEQGIYPLNNSERDLIFQHWTKGHANILVEKLLCYGQNEQSTQAIIVLLLKGPEELHSQVFNSIRGGIRNTSSATSTAPFLRAALIYCQTVEDYDCIEAMVKYVSAATRGLDNHDGKQNLRFFKDILEFAQPMDDLYLCVMSQIPTWAPGLLTYYESAVRVGTEEHLRQVLFRHGICPDLGSTPEDKARSTAILQVIRKLGVTCLTFLLEAFVRPRAQAVKAQLVGIQTVIDQCSSYYNDSAQAGPDSQFRDYYHSVVPALRKLTVEEVDEDVSEWENSDENFSSSEIMDGIAEQSATASNDLKDSDAQL